MADLVIDDTTVTVVLSVAEKIEAVHGDVTVPRSAVVRWRTVEDGTREVHGVRSPGTSVWGLVKAGTWRAADGVTFAVCHGRGPAVVLELTGQAYDRLVITVDHPGDVAAAFTSG